MTSDNENKQSNQASSEEVVTTNEDTLDESPVEREIRLNRIKAAVRSGTYQVDVEKVAKALERDLFEDESK